MKKLLRLLLICAGMALAGGGEAFAALSKATASGDEVWRLNCGAETFDYTDPSQNWWSKDELFTSLYRWGYSGGNAAEGPQAISGTALQAMFRTHRWGGTDMFYRIELPNGLYEVKLHFAETYWTAPGARVFDVALEGVTVLNGHDVFAEAGGNAADTHTFWPTITDGALDITFPQIVRDQAMISGIEIKPVQLSDDDFLDFVQRKMFWYFWNEVNPANGLVKDREDNWAAGASDYSSIAATGYALSVLTVGAKRGWITPQQARDRIMTTLNTFDSGIFNKNGFWYHFLKLSDGSRSGDTELSSVDSSLFILGALQAGEYFRPSYPEIAAKAEQLYRRMNWAWWTNRGPAEQAPFISQGWKPEYSTGSYNIPADGGYFLQDWWNRYSETVFVDFLAFGSPDFAISTAAWSDMTRHWHNDFGYHYIYEPGLFTHQYQHLYFTFKGSAGEALHDGFANYVQNITHATLQNRESCLAEPLLYDTHRWGLSACDGPNGYVGSYGARPNGISDGTVAPTAALASMPFTPQESIAAARHMFFQYKHHIWGRYGFSDGFNVSADFRSKDVLGLDQGPIILAIENYRSGMIWQTAMANPSLKAGFEKAGFKTYAQAPLYSASTTEGGQSRYSAKAAADGNPATRWSSAFSNDQWWSVEYSTPRPIGKVSIQWENAYGKSYKIQVSNDGQSWTDIYSEANGDGGLDVAAFPAVNAKHLRIFGIERGTIFGYSIYEVSVESDGLAPVLSGISAKEVTLQSAVIEWATDEPSDSQVEYGTTSAYGFSTPLNPGFSVLHQLPIGGLLPQTVYHYRVKSKDASGNLSVSGDQVFVTARNLIRNPGFENGENGWNFPGGASIDSSAAFAGQKSAKIKRNSVGTTFIDSVSTGGILPQTLYEASVYVKRQNIATNKPDGGAAASVRWFNASNGLIREDPIFAKALGNAPWQKFEADLVSPSGAAKAGIRLKLFKAKGTVWFDETALFAASSGAAVAASSSLETLFTGAALAEFTSDRQDPDGTPEDEAPAADAAFRLGEVFAFPNPSRRGQGPVLHVECGLADSVEFRFYDLSGALVHEGKVQDPPQVLEGRYAYEYKWDAGDLASGVYIYRVTAKKAGERDLLITKKLAVLR